MQIVYICAQMDNTQLPVKLDANQLSKIRLTISLNAQMESTKLLTQNVYICAQMDNTQLPVKLDANQLSKIRLTISFSAQMEITQLPVPKDVSICAQMES